MTTRLIFLVPFLAVAAFAFAASSGAGGAGGAAGDLNDFGRGSWKAIRQAHAGRPVVVHFWGVTCGPCRVEMPEWGKFLKERKDLDLVMINSDLVPDAPDAVRAMLAQNGLSDAENWIFNDGFVERLRYEIDPQWQGEIPRTVLIGRDGASATIDGVADLNVIRAWLDAQRPPPK
jgi:thiol-disulfide isomerase/thioredoxin